MKSLLELDQIDLESASKKQVAALVQALLEQVKKGHPSFLPKSSEQFKFKAQAPLRIP